MDGTLSMSSRLIGSSLVEMAMRAHGLIVFLSILSAPLAASPIDPTLSPLANAPTFPAELATAYSSFANPFLERAPESAAAFKEKAAAAAAGRAVAPIAPTPDTIEDAEVFAQVAEDHAALLQVLDGGARVYLPINAANAQVKYDCWAAAAALGAMAAGNTCRDFLQSEMARIRETLGFRPAPAMKGVVLFEFGEAGLNRWSDPVLDSVADVLAAERPEAIVVVDRADTVGTTATNAALSERRARTVERALEARGFGEEQVRYALVPLGKDDPVVETGDQVRLVYNRQVAIWAGRAAEVDAALAAIR
ncbi:MAG: OmpA family protein [Pseudomonadota bacterium]